MTSILVLGFLVGVRHAFEPDHVAAVVSLANRTTTLKQALRQGAVWGLGHTLTLFIVCGLALSLNTTISQQLGQYLEMIVGVMLVILGADVIRRVYRDRVHFHAHNHGGPDHFHAHSHKGETSAAHDSKSHSHQHKSQFPYRFLFVGLMHGMAGSAVLIVLAMQASTSVWQGLIYVALFGFGSIVGMTLFSAAITIPMRSAKALTLAHNALQLAIGGGTAVFGLFTAVTSVTSGGF